MNVRFLTRGALLAAVTVAMALIGLLPLGGELVLLLLPLPLSILTYQHGWKGAVLPLLVASLLLAFLGHISLALAVVLFYGLMGIALGNSLRKDAPLWIVFGGSAAAGAGGLASLWLLGKLIFKQDAFALMQQGLKTALGEAFKLYKSMPLASEQLKLLQQTQKMLLEMVDLAIPAMLALGLLLLLLVNFQASRKIIEAARATQDNRLSGRFCGCFAAFCPLALAVVYGVAVHCRFSAEEHR